MTINAAETQRRYYLFRHTGSAENIQWFCGINEYSYDYSKRHEDCALEVHKEYLIKCVNQSNEFFDVDETIKWIYVIGAVDVIVCVQIQLEIVDTSE